MLQDTSMAKCVLWFSQNCVYSVCLAELWFMENSLKQVFSVFQCDFSFFCKETQTHAVVLNGPVLCCSVTICLNPSLLHFCFNSLWKLNCSSLYTSFILCRESLKATKLKSNEPFRWFLLKLRLIVVCCCISYDSKLNAKSLFKKLRCTSRCWSNVLPFTPRKRWLVKGGERTASAAFCSEGLNTLEEQSGLLALCSYGLANMFKGIHKDENNFWFLPFHMKAGFISVGKASDIH